MVTEAERWGALWPYEPALTRFTGHFRRAYIRCKWEHNYIDELPFAGTVNFVEAAHLAIIISFSLQGSSLCVPYTRARHPELAKTDDIAEIAKMLRLGEIVDSRLFPFGHPPVDTEGRAIRNVDIEEPYIKPIGRWGEEWAIELAERYMARTHPDFEQAKQRMMGAYGVLFELELTLRVFIEHVLKAEHGGDWWGKTDIDQDIKSRVQSQMSDPQQNAWFDDVDESVLRFTMFDHLRRIIDKNRGLFGQYISDWEWFNQTMMYLSRPRNRIGHLRTFASAQIDEFIAAASRVLSLVPPQMRPKR